MRGALAGHRGAPWGTSPPAWPEIPLLCPEDRTRTWLSLPVRVVWAAGIESCAGNDPSVPKRHT